MTEEGITKIEKKAKTFKDYYEDPEWKARHLKKLSEKIKCNCGAMVSRGNMLRHKATRKHVKAIVEPEQKDNLLRLIELMKKGLI